MSIPKNQTFWMPYFNLPGPTAFPTYVCDIETIEGKPVKTATFPAPEPGQPSSILLRRSDFPRGTYLFKVRGQNSGAVIATYKITINPE